MKFFVSAGSDKKCEDVFDIYVMPELDRFVGELCDSDDYEDEPLEVIKQNVLKRVKSGEVIDLGEHWSGYGNPTQLLVVLKDGQDTKLGAMVESVFSHEAFRDG